MADFFFMCFKVFLKDAFQGVAGVTTHTEQMSQWSDQHPRERWKMKISHNATRLLPWKKSLCRGYTQPWLKSDIRPFGIQP